MPIRPHRDPPAHPDPRLATRGGGGRAVALRRLRADDGVALHAILADPLAMRFWSTPPHASLAATRGFVARSLMAQRDGVADEYVVLLDGAVVGKAGQWRAGELGFIFAPRVWGRGVARAALRTVMAQARLRGVAALRADVDPRNARCLALLARLGFRVTGRAARTWQVGGAWVDSVYLAATL